MVGWWLLGTVCDSLCVYVVCVAAAAGNAGHDARLAAAESLRPSPRAVDLADALLDSCRRRVRVGWIREGGGRRGERGVALAARRPREAAAGTVEHRALDIEREERIG